MNGEEGWTPDQMYSDPKEPGAKTLKNPMPIQYPNCKIWYKLHGTFPHDAMKSSPLLLQETDEKGLRHGLEIAFIWDTNKKIHSVRFAQMWTHGVRHGHYRRWRAQVLDAYLTFKPIDYWYDNSKFRKLDVVKLRRAALLALWIIRKRYGKDILSLITTFLRNYYVFRDFPIEITDTHDLYTRTIEYFKKRNEF